LWWSSSFDRSRRQDRFHVRDASVRIALTLLHIVNCNARVGRGGPLVYRDTNVVVDLERGQSGHLAILSHLFCLLIVVVVVP
jgi:hypothetical protein